MIILFFLQINGADARRKNKRNQIVE